MLLRGSSCGQQHQNIQNLGQGEGTKGTMLTPWAQTDGPFRRASWIESLVVICSGDLKPTVTDCHTVDQIDDYPMEPKKDMAWHVMTVSVPAIMQVICIVPDLRKNIKRFRGSLLCCPFWHPWCSLLLQNLRPRFIAMKHPQKLPARKTEFEHVWASSCSFSTWKLLIFALEKHRAKAIQALQTAKLSAKNTPQHLCLHTVWTVIPVIPYCSNEYSLFSVFLNVKHRNVAIRQTN